MEDMCVLIYNCFFCFDSGKRWAVTTKTWTPSEHIRSAMFLTPIKTTGFEPSISGGAAPSAATWRWSSQWGTAAAFPTCPAPAKRPLTSIITSLTRTQPLEALRLGWRTPGSKWTPSQQTRASPRWTSGAESWRSTPRCAASAPCLGTASTSPFRTTAAACLSLLSASFTASALVSSQTGRFSKKHCREQKVPPWWLLAESASLTQRRWMCPLSCTVTEMENGWCPLDAAFARLGMRLWRTGQFVEVCLPLLSLPSHPSLRNC